MPRLYHEPKQRHLRRIAPVLRVMEHRLSREHRPLMHPVESAHQPILGVPHLDAVHMPQVMQRGVGVAYPPIDPGSRPRGIGTGGHHVAEALIDRGAVRARGLAQRAGDVQLVRVEHPTSHRRPPSHVGGVVVDGHRKHACPVRLQRKGCVEFLGKADQVLGRPLSWSSEHRAEHVPHCSRPHRQLDRTTDAAVLT